MILYNAREISSGWMMAKFDDDFNVAAVYEVTKTSCSCPSPKVPCKHVNLLTKFLDTQRVNSDFFIAEDGSWHQPLAEPAPATKSQAVATICTEIINKPFVRRF